MVSYSNDLPQPEEGGMMLETNLGPQINGQLIPIEDL